MTLDALFMPAPMKVEGRRVQPLGEWPAVPTLDQRDANRRESYRRYAEKHREKRIAYMREYRARKAA